MMLKPGYAELRIQQMRRARRRDSAYIIPCRRGKMLMSVSIQTDMQLSDEWNRAVQLR